MSLRKLASTTGAALLLLTANAVSAQDLQVKQWASACANCHGTNGKAVGAAPALAGQPAAELIKNGGLQGWCGSSNHHASDCQGLHRCAN